MFNTFKSLCIYECIAIVKEHLISSAVPLHVFRNVPLLVHGWHDSGNLLVNRPIARMEGE